MGGVEGGREGKSLHPSTHPPPWFPPKPKPSRPGQDLVCGHRQLRFCRSVLLVQWPPAVPAQTRYAPPWSLTQTSVVTMAPACLLRLSPDLPVQSESAINVQLQRPQNFGSQNLTKNLWRPGRSEHGILEKIGSFFSARNHRNRLPIDLPNALAWLGLGARVVGGGKGSGAWGS